MSRWFEKKEKVSWSTKEVKCQCRHSACGWSAICDGGRENFSKKTSRWAEPSRKQQAKRWCVLACSRTVLEYSSIDAWRVCEGGRGKRASGGRDGKKGRMKAGVRLAFEFPDASTVQEHTSTIQM